MKRLLVVGALLTAAACTSDGGPESPSPPGTAGTTEATGAPVSTIPREEGNPTPQRVGRPFRFDLKISETEKTVLQLTVRRPITCGIKGFALPEDPFTGDPARRAYAPKGLRYCRVDVTAKNVGKRQTQLTLGGYIYDTDDRQFQHDEELTTELGSREGMPFGSNTVELAPTRSANTFVIFAIPVGAAPAYVELAENGVTEDVYGGRHDVRVDIVASDVSWKNPRGS